MKFLKQGFFSTIVCPRGKNNPRNSPDIVLELKDGSLLLPYTRKQGRADEARETTLGKISHDRGRTWGRSFRLLATDGKMYSGAMSWLKLKSGKVAVVVGRMDGYDDMKNFFRYSTDECTRFSPPVLITPRPGYNCPCNGRLVQLDNGRLLYPIAFIPRSRVKGESYSVFVYFSDDDGETWREAKSRLRLPMRGAMEPVVAEIKNGRCMMLIRTQLGSQYQSFSGDGGETWSKPQPSALVSPEAGAFLTRMPSTGHLLACWNYDFKPHWPRRHYGLRCPLTVAVSKDGGKTWENIKDIEDDHRFSYGNPNISFIRGHAYVTYYQGYLINEWGVMDAKLTILPESFFYSDQSLDRAIREMPKPKSSLW
jgi:hypothetical protein